MEGGRKVACSARVWYHALPVHPGMCNNWLLNAYPQLGRAQRAPHLW